MDNIELHERLERIEKLLVSNKKVLNFDEASDYIGISRSYLYKLTSENIIPFSKPNGKKIFFDKEKLNAWLLRNGRKSKGEIESDAMTYSIKKSGNHGKF